MAVTRTIAIHLLNPLWRADAKPLICKGFIFASKTGNAAKTTHFLAKTVFQTIFPQSYPQCVWIAWKTVWKPIFSVLFEERLEVDLQAINRNDVFGKLFASLRQVRGFAGKSGGWQFGGDRVPPAGTYSHKTGYCKATSIFWRMISASAIVFFKSLFLKEFLFAWLLGILSKPAPVLCLPSVKSLLCTKLSTAVVEESKKHLWIG